MAVRIPVIVALFVLTFWRLNAQDSHYWTPKYGTKSTLLGGAVVGSHLDISSTFYNPGALGIMENPAFVITGWVFNITSLQFESAAGHDNDIGSLHLSPAPDYFTALIPTASKNKIAYTFLNRYKMSERLSARDSFSKDVLYRPGQELFAGDYFLDQYLNENWAGLTWSRALTDYLGLGVSNFVAFRSQKFRSDIHTQAFAEDKTAAQSTNTRQATYYNFRLLWKLGLAADLDPLKLGLAVTTPSINIFGRGSSHLSTTITGMNIQNYAGSDFVEFDDQVNLPSTYKSPLSVAIGGSFRMNKTTVHVSLEWFDHIHEYKVLPTTSFTSQATGEKRRNAIIQDLNSVTNFGIGMQQVRSDHFEVYASFVSDFSAVSPTSNHNTSIITWNFYHVMAGALFRLWRSEVTAGIGYSFGHDQVQQNVDFDSAHEDNLLIGELSEETGRYSNLTLLVGFSIFPKELFEKTLEGLPFFKKND